MLTQHALLVSLTLHRWNNTRLDRKTTKEILMSKEAHSNAGKFTKNLIDPLALRPVESILNQVRIYHYRQTLPWEDRRCRILPAKLYIPYTQEIASYKQQLNDAVANLIKIYPSLIEDSKVRLNGLFDESEYPTAAEIQNQYRITLDAMPFDTGELFRMLEIPDTERDELIKNAIEKEKLKLAEAQKEMWVRLKDCVASFTNIEGESKRIYDSMFTHLKNVVELIPMYSEVLNDPVLEEMAVECRSLLNSYSVRDLRSASNKDAVNMRAEVAQASRDLLATIEQNMSAVFGEVEENVAEEIEPIPMSNWEVVEEHPTPIAV